MMAVYFTELPPTPETTHFNEYAKLTIESCGNDVHSEGRLYELGTEVGHTILGQLRGSGVVLTDGIQAADEIINSLSKRIEPDENKDVGGKHAFLAGAREATLEEIIAQLSAISTVEEIK